MTANWLKVCLAGMLALFLGFTFHLTWSAFNDSQRTVRAFDETFLAPISDDDFRNVSSSGSNFSNSTNAWRNGRSIVITSVGTNGATLRRFRKSVNLTLTSEHFVTDSTISGVATTHTIDAKVTVIPSAKEAITKDTNTTLNEDVTKLEIPTKITHFQTTMYSTSSSSETATPEMQNVTNRLDQTDLAEITIASNYSVIEVTLRTTLEPIERVVVTTEETTEKVVNKTTVAAEMPLLVKNVSELDSNISYEETTENPADDEPEEVRMSGMSIPENGYIVMTATCVLAICLATAILIWIAHKRRVLSRRVNISAEYLHNVDV